MKYYSTRNKDNKVSSMEAIIRGIAEDGGLFVPESIPTLSEFESLKDFSYKELAKLIVGMYFDDYPEEDINAAINGAYGEKFGNKEPVKLVEKAGVHFLELFHGPTLAFKDMALTVLPYLMRSALLNKGIEEEVVVLTATSGDTGKAALEGFRDVPGVNVVVFYPKDGVSELQRLQMVTQRGDNTHVVAIEGNFDDAQKGVKDIFGDVEYNKELKESGYVLSSANSINIGRLIPQVVYYVYGYLNLLKEEKIKAGQEINIVVPTGNFGNILAAYYAKEMGLPVDRLICASNDNKVLTDFFETGLYDKERKLLLTSSPSMDILVSSNLERFLFHISGKNQSAIQDMMDKLSKEGSFRWSDFSKEEIYGEFADEVEVSTSIDKMFRGEGYVMDPHTAVAYSVYKKFLKETGDDKPVIIASTASPFKFPGKVISSMGKTVPKNLFEGIEIIADAMEVEIPSQVSELENLPVLHRQTCKKEEMKNAVLELLQGGKSND
ncbi:threonine synthase [Gudongella sp. DL1XJH-153]|uniref:threonine synthase n=1 Tax=Gudongella sp. DL1XJH-153 TaxID=3409804 RepID=UPI003BB4DC87